MRPYLYITLVSLSKKKSTTPRVTSVSVYNISTGEPKSYSLHIEALKKQYDIRNLTCIQLDASERALLQNFYKFVKAHQTCFWVHWNMKNSKYGFDALQNRYEILTKKKAPVVRMQNRYDLSLLLKNIYSSNYESSRTGSKLLSLAHRNNFQLEGILAGKQEANAYYRKDFQGIVASSQDKAEAIGLIVKAVGEKRLKVSASWREIYGVSIPGALLYIGYNFNRAKKIVSGVSGILGGVITLWNFDYMVKLYKHIVEYFTL